jgi:hypothetical protein
MRSRDSRDIVVGVFVATLSLSSQAGAADRTIGN